MSEQHPLPGFLEKPAPETDWVNWRREFWKKTRRAEKIYGKGPTYPPETIELILEGIVPEWIFHGILFERNPVLRDQCERARVALLKLHALLNSAGNWRSPRDVKE